MFYSGHIVLGDFEIIEAVRDQILGGWERTLGEGIRDKLG